MNNYMHNNKIIEELERVIEVSKKKYKDTTNTFNRILKSNKRMMKGSLVAISLRKKYPEAKGPWNLVGMNLHPNVPIPTSCRHMTGMLSFNNFRKSTGRKAYPMRTNKCVCGETTLKHNFYIYNQESDIVEVIGSSCVRAYTGVSFSKKCTTCFKPYRGKYDDCKGCRVITGNNMTTKDRETLERERDLARFGKSQCVAFGPFKGTTYSFMCTHHMPEMLRLCAKVYSKPSEKYGSYRKMVCDYVKWRQTIDNKIEEQDEDTFISDFEPQKIVKKLPKYIPPPPVEFHEYPPDYFKNVLKRNPNKKYKNLTFYPK